MTRRGTVAEPGACAAQGVVSGGSQGAGSARRPVGRARRSWASSSQVTTLDGRRVVLLVDIMPVRGRASEPGQDGVGIEGEGAGRGGGAGRRDGRGRRRRRRCGTTRRGCGCCWIRWARGSTRSTATAITTLCNATFRRMLGFEREEDAIGRKAARRDPSLASGRIALRGRGLPDLQDRRGPGSRPMWWERCSTAVDGTSFPGRVLGAADPFGRGRGGGGLHIPGHDGAGAGRRRHCGRSEERLRLAQRAGRDRDVRAGCRARGC